MRYETRQRRSQEELTPAQQRRFVRVAAGVFCFVFCWVLFAPGAGLFALFSERGKLCRAKEQFARLHTHNEILRNEIEKINNDPAFLEKVVRERGFLRKGEMVFDFSGGAK